MRVLKTESRRRARLPLVFAAITGTCIAAAPGQAQEVWTVEPEPILSIGAPVGSFVGDLYRVSSTAFLSDGGIAVADEGQRILTFDASGLPRWSVGREGEGPGEFQMLSRIQPFAGDSIWAWDWNQFRMTVLAPGGAVVSTANLHGVPPPEVVGRFDDGTVLGLVRNVPLNPGGYFAYTTTMLRLDDEGQTVNTIGTVDGGEGLDGGRRGLRILGNGSFFRDTQFHVRGKEVFVATGDSLTVSVFSYESGVLRTIHGVLRRLPADSRALRQVFPDRSRLLEEFVPGGRTLPEVTRLIVDDDDNVWVQRYRNTRRSGREGGEWAVFDQSGGLRATLETPARFRLDQVRDGLLLGVWEDELDREFVHVYRIRHSPN